MVVRAFPMSVESSSEPLGKDFLIYSKEMKDLTRFIKSVAPTDTPVLITGETGTGKELVASAIHRLSHRALGKPFVVADCATFSNSSVIDSELFGHERGSFTGAFDLKIGFFERADGGTIFIDEISKLSLGDQAKLLRVLETNQIRRVGGKDDKKLNIRVIIATNSNLRELVESGHFLPDLFYRLDRIRLNIPPLRERVEDIRPLIDFFSAKQEFNGMFSSELLHKMMTYLWPGNVRELRNVVERAIFLMRANIVDIDYVLNFKNEINSEKYRPASLEDLKKEHLKKTLNHTGNKKSEAARILDVTPKTLSSMIKRYNISGN